MTHDQYLRGYFCLVGTASVPIVTTLRLRKLREPYCLVIGPRGGLLYLRVLAEGLAYGWAGHRDCRMRHT